MGAIAVTGAGGFVGCRLVEKCILDGNTDIFPVVRSNRSLARLCRFGIGENTRFADGRNENSLARAFEGCDSVVNLITGTPPAIVESTKAIHSACVKAGVKRLIHMSSAVVFGMVESPETGDDSPLMTRHWMPYARAKAESELFLRQTGGSLSPEITVLRPGIVWGPRSRWSVNAAWAMKNGTAYLVGDGSGICNSIHIDNLVACILTCIASGTDASGFFNVSDEETVTWKDFYASLAEYVNYDMTKMPSVRSDRFPLDFHSFLEDLKSTDLYGRLKESLTPEYRAIIKNALKGISGRRKGSGGSASRTAAIRVTRETWHLQSTRHKLSNRKFAERFGYVSPVSFAAGTESTIEWLNYLGM